MAVIRLNQPKNDGPAREQVTRRDFDAMLRRAGLDAVPVDVTRVADMLGLSIIYEAMEDDLSGYLELRGNVWTIGINTYHHPNRQRYSIAHEIGHYVLHRDRQNRFDDVTFARRTGGRPNEMELEADQFAADLLMPADRVRGLVASGVTSLQDLAQRFAVSGFAMQYRVRSLGYSVN